MPTLSASIVTYKNKPEVLQRTIECYLAASGNGKLYVLDNSPTDEARKLCVHSSIEYIFNGANIGYGRAQNIALRKSIEQKAKYHLVLNPDVYFDPHILEELTSFMERSKEVGLVMPKVLFPDGQLQTLCRLLPIPHKLFMRRFLPVFKKRITEANHEYEMLFTNYQSIEDVPFLSGCFMLMRCDALQQVGLFDERFFLYFEDTDLSRRIHEQYRTVYYPNVSIHHVHERSSYKEIRSLLHHINSAVHYFNKWGWINDSKREIINNRILVKHRVNGYKLQAQ
jgi:GT2 family glycosyltransferase